MAFTDRPSESDLPEKEAGKEREVGRPERACNFVRKITRSDISHFTSLGFEVNGGAVAYCFGVTLGMFPRIILSLH